MPVGTMVLNRNVANNFAENEQISFGTGVLVDGLDFSDDKMLVGRTFSYSDTQRYRVGPNYLQLPVTQAKHADVRTNQRDGLMTYHVDGEGENPHVNYEPSITGGLREAEYPTHDEQGSVLTGRLTRKHIPRTTDYLQAGQRYLLMQEWERDDLVPTLVANLKQCDRPIQERMVGTSSWWRTTSACASARGWASRPRTSPTWSPCPAGAERGGDQEALTARQERPARRRGAHDDTLRAEREGVNAQTASHTLRPMIAMPRGTCRATAPEPPVAD
ncbi:hypothetical protein FHR33_008563 [Nonomuraea dietziae]|uniref:catalase n=1 Tax=Nonomuraea dietziae TaxID=65515 RepID=A0A7W5VIP3_9ACTN|nr:hypothetical protein [Nonomuraea dietziae]